MKNNIKNIILIVAATTCFASCNDDYLERFPLSINDGVFWGSANDVMLYANGFYNYLPTYDWGRGIYGRDAEMGSDTEIQVDYNRYLNGESTLPSSGGGWSPDDWAQLRNINHFMDNYQKAPVPFDDIKAYVGEALFFRALFYFNKVRTFGDVPYATTVIQMDSEILFQPRLPRDQAVDKIMLDLDNAVEYLPGRTATWTGRLTKEVAMLLQARIALYEGTWEKHHARKNTQFKAAGADGSKFIRKAAEVSGALMDLAEASGYTALDNTGVENGYFNLFNKTDYSASKEILFWKKYSIEDNVWHSNGRFLGGRIGATKNLIDSYLCTDGKPIAVSPLYQGDATLKSVVANRDPRLNQTIYVDDGKHKYHTNVPEGMIFQRPTFEGDMGNICPSGYQIYKGENPDGYSASLQFVEALIHFRYAEALLIYAEARAELNEITQSDIDRTVNALRRRVGMNDGLLDISNIAVDPNWDFSDISPLLNEIRRERKVELACEGYRRDDIFRWAAADELIVDYIPKGAVKEQWRDSPGASVAFVTAWEALNVDEQGYIHPYKPFAAMSAGYQFNIGRDYLSPIPTDQLTLNPALGQNPGWK